MADLLKPLREILGNENLLSSGTDLLAYSFTPASLRADRHDPLPLAIARPTLLSALSPLINFCRDNRLPLRARGGNCGWWNRPLPENTIILDTSRLNRVLEFNPANRQLHAQCGVNHAWLREITASENLFLPCVAPAEASLGAVLACNEWGPESARYGLPANHAVAVKVWDGTGNSRVFHMQNSHASHLDSSLPAGSLFCGSRGELGIIGEAWLKLAPMPDAGAKMLALFDTPASLTASLLALRKNKCDPASLMIFNKGCLHSLKLPLDCAWLLAMYFLDDACVIERKLRMAQNCISENDGRLVQDKFSDFENWQVRLASINASQGRPWQGDRIGCPPERLCGLLENLDSLFQQYQIDGLVFGAPLAGRLAVLANSPNQEKVAAFFHDLLTLDLVLNGLLESEDKVPQNRQLWQAKSPCASIDRSLRELFDPDNIFSSPADNTRS